MKKLLIGALVAITAGLSVARGQTPSGVSVIRLDPAFDAIVPQQAKVEILKNDYFGFTEGPVWMTEGQYLLFSDMGANKIYKWTPKGELSVFLDPSGYTGDPRKVRDAMQSVLNNGRLWVNLVGSNGLAVDREGRLILCARGDRALVRLEKTGQRTTLADRFEGKRFIAPNDVVVKSDGAIYFTDYGGYVAPDAAPAALYRWHDDTLQLLGKEYKDGMPNGLAFSPDEKYLYLAAGKILRFAVRLDGTLGDQQVFVADSNADGMKVDQKGNLYFGGPGGLWIVSPEGKHLGTIPKPNNTNLAFGDADRKTLYLTTISGLARIRLNVPGL
jgi:gluconolactonase